MNLASFIVIDGKHYLWKDIVALRREQLAAAVTAKARQLALFDGLPEDYRPATVKTAAARYQEPTLFQM